MANFTESQVVFMRDAYESLGDMVSMFNKPIYDEDMTDDEVIRYMKQYFKKACRDFGVNGENFDEVIDQNSEIATYFTNRIQYYTLKDFRFKGAIQYKFSSAKDGFEVDKSKIYANLNDMIKQLEDEYDRKVSGLYHHGILQFSADSYTWTETE